MRRRDFMGQLLRGSLAGTALVGAGAVGAGCGGASTGGEAGAPAVSTGKKIRWRLVSSFPRSLDTLFGGAEGLSARVSAMTDGNFDIRVYPAGEIVPGLQVLDAVQQGTVQVGQTASYYYTGKNPALAFDTCVPFGMRARQQTAWLLEGGGQAEVQRLFDDFGVITFPSGNTGVQMGGWFKREVNGLADLSGIKMRIPGLGGDVMSALGVTVQQIPGGEIFPALERGAIDATEWVGPYDDEKLGFHKVAQFYYYPGWWEPGPSLSFYVGKKAWDALPKTYQEIFRAATLDAGATMQARYDARNPPALQRLLAGGTQMRPFSEEIMKGAQAAATEMFESSAAKDAGYKRIYEHWKKFRDDSARWFGTAELAYGRFSIGAD